MLVNLLKYGKGHNDEYRRPPYEKSSWEPDLSQQSPAEIEAAEHFRDVSAEMQRGLSANEFERNHVVKPQIAEALGSDALGGQLSAIEQQPSPAPAIGEAPAPVTEPWTPGPRQ